MRNVNTSWIAIGLLVLAGEAAGQGMYGDKKYGEYYEEDKQWVEQEAAPPAWPGEQTLIEFNAGPVTRNRYYIDAATLSVGADRVVRYVIVIKTSGGATNISYEGIRCDSGERKAYAFGRNDMTWANARTSSWQPIVRPSYQAVLSREYFCPNGVAIMEAKEGVFALRRGGHPDAK